MDELLLQQIASSLQHIEQLVQQMTDHQPSIKRAAKVDAVDGIRFRSRTKPEDLNYKDYPSFAAFFDAYPLHRGKYAAFRRWHQLASKNELLQQQMIAGARAYRDDPTRDPAKTKHAEGWLNDRRWEDEYKLVNPAPVEDVEFFDLEKHLREQIV